jgi:hypothetical protein
MALREKNREAQSLVSKSQAKSSWMVFRIFIVVLSALSIGLPHSGVKASGANVGSLRDGHGVPKEAREFPLWSMVPSKAFAVLDEGVIRQQRWGLYAFRGRAPYAGQKPCIELVTLYFGSPAGGLSLQSNHVCGMLSPPAEQPLLMEGGITVAKTIGGPTVSDSIFGMAMALDVQTARFVFEPNMTRRFHLKLLTKDQARKARLPQFKYIAFGVAKAVCVSQVEATDSHGQTVVETPMQRCS